MRFPMAGSVSLMASPWAAAGAAVGIGLTIFPQWICVSPRILNTLTLDQGTPSEGPKIANRKTDLAAKVENPVAEMADSSVREL